MCGIAGIIDPIAHAEELRASIRRMMDTQAHRGPDGDGFYDGDGVSLGHRRLAIIDLTDSGHQPMTDDERRLWLTFNGEIYNFVELRAELETLGHRFVSHSDSEVLLHAYKEWRSDCVTKLRGMFAFAVWDEDARTLFAARDRFGIKPFHYWTDGRRLAFASELKALVPHLPERRVNARLAREFLAWNLLDHESEETFLEGIRRLPPAHTLTWKHGEGLRIDRYWALSVTDALETPPDARRSLEAEFRERFGESISLHLRSDVPVGTCLSGGLDSSSIVGVVSEELRRRGSWREGWQHTFSACFDVPRIDERPYIASVVEKTECEPHLVFPRGERMREDLERWLWHQEEPVASTGSYSQYCVARLARESGIKVLLDGQGADELFAGYRKFILVYLRQLMQSGRTAKAMAEAVRFFGSPEILRTSRLVDGRRYLSGASAPVAELFGGDEPPRAAGLAIGSSLGRRIEADLFRFSLPILLRYEDRNTMAFGIESRVPFIDHVFAEWAATLPADMRLSGGWTKRIIRDALAGSLPDRVRRRKSKLGFSTPESDWLAGPLREWLVERLTESRHLDAIVEGSRVRVLLARWQAGDRDPALENLLFRLAVYESWARMFLGDAGRVADVSTPPAVPQKERVRVVPMTAAHLAEATRVHLDAFRGYMTADLGAGYSLAMLQWFMNLERGVALVALDADGRVIGYVVGSPIRAARTMNRALFWTAARAAVLRPRLMLQSRFIRRVSSRLAAMAGRSGRSADTPATNGDVMSLVGIGVAGDAAGKGAARLMMDAFEARCRALGVRTMRLSVYASNERARALYERCGWTPHHTPGSDALYYSRTL